MPHREGRILGTDKQLHWWWYWWGGCGLRNTTLDFPMAKPATISLTPGIMLKRSGRDLQLQSHTDYSRTHRERPVRIQIDASPHNGKKIDVVVCNRDAQLNF